MRIILTEDERAEAVAVNATGDGNAIAAFLGRLFPKTGEFDPFYDAGLVAMLLEHAEAESPCGRTGANSQEKA